MRLLQLNISEEMSGRKVKSLLTFRFKLPEHRIAVLKQRENAILLNGAPCRTIDVVHTGDMLQVDVEDVPIRRNFPPCTVSPDVRFEDDDLCILNKSAGMAVHGEAKETRPTVEQMMAAYWGSERPFHPVNRLDRDTTGLMVIAKNGYMTDRLRQMLHTDCFVREYMAVVHGVLKEAEGSITLPLARENEATTRRIPRENGQAARTDYQLLQQGRDLALVRVRLYTGRTHQIRAHFAAIGCPLLGDTLYGAPAGAFCRPALHSAQVRLEQPITGEKIVCTAELPEDMAEICRIIE